MWRSFEDRTKLLEGKEAEFYKNVSDINDLKIRQLVTLHNALMSKSGQNAEKSGLWLWLFSNYFRDLLSEWPKPQHDTPYWRQWIMECIYITCLWYWSLCPSFEKVKGHENICFCKLLIRVETSIEQGMKNRNLSDIFVNFHWQFYSSLSHLKNIVELLFSAILHTRCPFF